MEKNILLSICIPTYNRASYLKLSLKRIIEQITIDMPIEIIVSDNFSPDNTIDVASQYLDLPYFKLVKQKSNIGPMRNALDLISKHARGKFCWFVGDDDYVVTGAIKNLLEIIKSNDVDFIFLNLQPIKTDVDFSHYQLRPQLNFELLSKFELLLLPKYSQIFAAELMASVFKKDLFLKEKEVYNKIDVEYLSTLESSYLHCVIFANQFMGKKAIYVKDIMILADSRAREWSDKSAYLVVEQFYNLIVHYKINGLEKAILKQCEHHFIKISIGDFSRFLLNRNLKYRDRISFSRYIYFLITRPVMTFNVLAELALKSFKK
jgi:glycosyltransferase involved in cell wall biosynthesis